jgi:microcystin degradation protein MlrC
MPDMVMTGLANAPMQMGDSALVEANGIDIVLIAAQPGHGHRSLYPAWLRPRRKDHRGQVVAALLRLLREDRAHVIYAAAPGAVTLDLRTLPYRKVHRPKWPLDPA